MLQQLRRHQQEDDGSHQRMEEAHAQIPTSSAGRVIGIAQEKVAGAGAIKRISRTRRSAGHAASQSRIDCPDACLLPDTR